jgi:MoxR-like ATPase
MTYPIIVKIALGAGKKGQTPRATVVSTGEDITRSIAYVTLKGASDAGKWLYKASEDAKWQRVEPNTAEPVAKAAKSKPAAMPANAMAFKSTSALDLQSYVAARPADIIMKDLNWKFICRTVVRGGNILLTGPTGTGKSQTAIAVAKALGRELFYINLGATQDPRGSLIGNTHFGKEQGTFFNESAFVRAIQTENTVILLDELSRAHPEAWNILMTVLDPGQRYLRLDEAVNAPVVHVAKGVSFVGTANIGGEYTAVRVMDRALLDRFVIAEIPHLEPKEESSLLKRLFPELPKIEADNLAEIAGQTRMEYRSDSAKISTPISTRSVVEMAGLIMDGFTLQECAEVAIYPLYSQDGGMQSERTFVKQLVQKFVKDDTAESLMGEEDTTEYPF